MSLQNLPDYPGPVIAIDPGGTTGISVLSTPTDKTIRTMTFRTIYRPDKTKKAVNFTPEKFFEFLNKVDWHIIIIENFVADNMIDRFGIYTIQLVGAVKMFAYIKGVQVFVQPPQYRRSSQKQMEQILAGRDVVIHERDATMHLLAFIEKGPNIAANTN